MSDTKKRLDALNKRISDDWNKMGFAPTQTVADPRAKYVGNNRDIFRGANSPFASTGSEPRQKKAEAPKPAPVVRSRTAPVSDNSFNRRVEAAPPPKPKIRADYLAAPKAVPKAVANPVKTTKSAKAPKTKASTRSEFDKEFARQRAMGAKYFTFKGKRYSTKVG
jgi:hypothetical protein